MNKSIFCEFRHYFILSSLCLILGAAPSAFSAWICGQELRDPVTLEKAWKALRIQLQQDIPSIHVTYSGREWKITTTGGSIVLNDIPDHIRDNIAFYDRQLLRSERNDRQLWESGRNTYVRDYLRQRLVEDRRFDLNHYDVQIEVISQDRSSDAGIPTASSVLNDLFAKIKNGVAPEVIDHTMDSWTLQTDYGVAVIRNIPQEVQKEFESAVEGRGGVIVEYLKKRYNLDNAPVAAPKVVNKTPATSVPKVEPMDNNPEMVRNELLSMIENNIAPKITEHTADSWTVSTTHGHMLIDHIPHHVQKNFVWFNDRIEPRGISPRNLTLTKNRDAVIIEYLKMHLSLDNPELAWHEILSNLKNNIAPKISEHAADSWTIKTAHGSVVINKIPLKVQNEIVRLNNIILPPANSKISKNPRMIEVRDEVIVDYLKKYLALDDGQVKTNASAAVPPRKVVKETPLKKIPAIKALVTEAPLPEAPLPEDPVNKPSANEAVANKTPATPAPKVKSMDNNPELAWNELYSDIEKNIVPEINEYTLDSWRIETTHGLVLIDNIPREVQRDFLRLNKRVGSHSIHTQYTKSIKKYRNAFIVEYLKSHLGLASPELAWNEIRSKIENNIAPKIIEHTENTWTIKTTHRDVLIEHIPQKVQEDFFRFNNSIMPEVTSPGNLTLIKKRDGIIINYLKKNLGLDNPEMARNEILSKLNNNIAPIISEHTADNWTVKTTHGFVVITPIPQKIQNRFVQLNNRIPSVANQNTLWNPEMIKDRDVIIVDYLKKYFESDNGLVKTDASVAGPLTEVKKKTLVTKAQAPESQVAPIEPIQEIQEIQDPVLFEKTLQELKVKLEQKGSSVQVKYSGSEWKVTFDQKLIVMKDIPVDVQNVIASYDKRMAKFGPYERKRFESVRDIYIRDYLRLILNDVNGIQVIKAPDAPGISPIRVIRTPKVGTPIVGTTKKKEDALDANKSDQASSHDERVNYE